jgi:hypothetical protein
MQVQSPLAGKHQDHGSLVVTTAQQRFQRLDEIAFSGKKNFAS